MSEYMEKHTVSAASSARRPAMWATTRVACSPTPSRETPYAVVVLDEIEKAHPDVFNVLLQIMDHGKLTDNNGKATDFRHVVLLMTSNVGARDLAKRAVGFGDARSTGDAEREYKNLFSPEFRNRLDARIAFAALSRETMSHIVGKFVRELEGQLVDRQVMITVTDAAREYLGTAGYDPDYGARPLARVIQNQIKQPLGEELLFGRLEKGGRVIVDAVEDGKTDGGDPKMKLVFEYPDAPAPVAVAEVLN